MKLNKFLNRREVLFTYSAFGLSQVNKYGLMDKTTIGNSRLKLNMYKQTLPPLTKTQLAIGIGVMLGDASLQTQNKEKSFRLKFEQSDYHKPYLDHLVSVFEPWVLSEPRKITRTNRKTGNIYYTWQFQTISHESFSPLANLCLDQNFKKTVKSTIKKPFTAHSLAYWFMDDGGKLDYTSNQGKGIVLNTQNFNYSEVSLLKNLLTEKYHLECWIKENKNKPIIAISGRSYGILEKEIGSLILPSMRYKFPTKRKKRSAKS